MPHSEKPAGTEAWPRQFSILHQLEQFPLKKQIIKNPKF